jgi:hypothetical protein
MRRVGSASKRKVLVERPKVFISYSHDSEPHKAWVRGLASDLLALGIEVTLDQWDLALGEDMAAFMERGLSESTRVLLVCTETYVEKANAGSGGVGYERLIVSGELVAKIDTKKFVPVIRQSVEPRTTPTFLGPRLYIDFSDDGLYGKRIGELADEVLGRRSASKPPVAEVEFASVPGELPARIAGVSGRTALGAAVLDDEWFSTKASTAVTALEHHGTPGAMEVRFGLHEPIAKSQLELLNAVRVSEIHTFGWPFAVTLENRPEYRPRPVADGIFAEIPIEGKGFSGEPSYDYWAARSNGDFFAVQSYFEDQRATAQLFFNTRIVRVTEALLFAARYYENLGVVGDARFSIRVKHTGLAGRTLSSSSPNRQLFARLTSAAESEVEITPELGTVRDHLVDHVTQILAPLFMLFDFMEFNGSVYTDIVRRFEAGHVT